MPRRARRSGSSRPRPATAAWSSASTSSRSSATSTTRSSTAASAAWRRHAAHDRSVQLHHGSVHAPARSRRAGARTRGHLHRRRRVERRADRAHHGLVRRHDGRSVTTTSSSSTRRIPRNRLLLDTHSEHAERRRDVDPAELLAAPRDIDRSGRYVMLYPTGADQALPRKARAVRTSGTPQTGDVHRAGVVGAPVRPRRLRLRRVGQPGLLHVAPAGTPAQWQFRSLATPLLTRDLITTVLRRRRSTWRTTRRGTTRGPIDSVPFISGTYRYGIRHDAWRAWDDEIIAVQTDAAPGADADGVALRAPPQRRPQRHRTPRATSFWYMPRPNVSPDGRWVLFTSNWEKTLGIDPTGEPGDGRAAGCVRRRAETLVGGPARAAAGSAVARAQHAHRIARDERDGHARQWVRRLGGLAGFRGGRGDELELPDVHLRRRWRDDPHLDRHRAIDARQLRVQAVSRQ